jgi:hypothetical protein
MVRHLKKLMHMFKKRGVPGIEVSYCAAKKREKDNDRPDAVIIASAKVSCSAIVGTDNEWNNKDIDFTFYNITKYRN